MAEKKKSKNRTAAPSEQSEPGEEIQTGPSETTVDKGADETPEGMWRCPHCATVYRRDMEVAQRNHLWRVHGSGS